MNLTDSVCLTCSWSVLCAAMTALRRRATLIRARGRWPGPDCVDALSIRPDLQLQLALLFPAQSLCSVTREGRYSRARADARRLVNLGAY